jgi:hypothetical protein
VILRTGIAVVEAMFADLLRAHCPPRSGETDIAADEPHVICHRRRGVTWRSGLGLWDMRCRLSAHVKQLTFPASSRRVQVEDDNQLHMKRGTRSDRH